MPAQYQCGWWIFGERQNEEEELYTTGTLKGILIFLPCCCAWKVSYRLHYRLSSQPLQTMQIYLWMWHTDRVQYSRLDNILTWELKVTVRRSIEHWAYAVRFGPWRPRVKMRYWRKLIPLHNIENMDSSSSNPHVQHQTCLLHALLKILYC